MVIPDVYPYREIWPNKTPLQSKIFTFGIMISILLVNTLEILTTDTDNFLTRLSKSTLTIILVYLAGAGVWYLLGKPQTLNLFHYYRNTAVISGLLTIFITLIGLIIMEVLQRILFFFFKKTIISRYIPSWLRMS
ncbi:hypothetical protein DF182_00320 [Chitinophaga flava]|uniref:Uncharacterized protein n=1 Tax=Chitinophaga flava TaxID=2259036 RepID=A0A365XY00_9BACT|nr:hypothetical protein DF182_00320 [Chitinophaga flava]